MTICQTLWTNRKDLLKDPFGWLSPQHHLMGWALSCLKLKEFYPTVNLHTDADGVAIFRDTLGLPYTNVFDDYSNLTYPPALWAASKVLTYAKQQTPFLHCDGDVFVWKPFKDELWTSGLVAQNLEKGTIFYRNMFKPLLDRFTYLSPSLRENLQSPYMQAYNAGLIGGTDTAFFQRFADDVIDLIEKNEGLSLYGNFNIVFEQLFFFTKATQEKKTVACLWEKIYDDNGYAKVEVADFTRARQLGYLHVIGNHKRDKEVCDWVARHLYRLDPEVYLRIVQLFRKEHYFYGTKIREEHPEVQGADKRVFRFAKTVQFIKRLKPDMAFRSNAEVKTFVDDSGNVLLKALFRYEQRLSRICAKFARIPTPDLKRLEDGPLTMFGEDSPDDTVLRRSPHIEIVHSAFDWPGMRYPEPDGVHIQCSAKEDLVIGVVPELFFEGYRDLSLDGTCVNIMLLSEDNTRFGDLVEKMRGFFPASRDDAEHNALRMLLCMKVEFLIHNKILLKES